MEFKQLFQYFRYAQQKYQNAMERGAISEKELFKRNVVISRLMAQYTVDEANKAMDEYNSLRRMKERFKHQGVMITALNAQTDILLNEYRDMQNLLASYGKMLCVCLDGWQLNGATYEDLFNFCCCSEKTISDMKKDIADGTVLFSDLVCIHYPDDKNKGNFIDNEDYAPITQAVKEYMCKSLQNACKDKNSRAKVNNKLFELFPEIKDSCVMETVDEFGDTIYTDLDGLPVDFE